MSRSISLYKQLANHKLINQTINFDLKRIKSALKKLGNPEKKLGNVINFLGSSGKFTTLHSVKCFIEANKQTTTAYISPSLRDIKERFWMGDRFLTHQEIKKSIKLITKLKVPLTVFEALTIIYIINASQKNTDYHLVEAGALFAKDSTNVFDFPLAQVIVNINKQHLNFLAKNKKTLEEVVFQKVGFLSNFTRIYVGKQKPDVLIKIAAKYIRNSNIFTQSKKVKEFEQKWSKWLGVKYSIFVNSGSSANYLTFLAIKIIYGTGEVIVPPLTWNSDINAVIQNDFKAKFVDINLNTLSMDPKKILKNLSKNTKAVFLTHAQGFNGLTDELIKSLKLLFI